MQRRKNKEEDDNLITDEQTLKDAGYGSLKKISEPKTKDYIYETVALPETTIKLSGYESLGNESEPRIQDADKAEQNTADRQHGKISFNFLEIPQVSKNRYLLINKYSRKGQCEISS